MPPKNEGITAPIAFGISEKDFTLLLCEGQKAFHEALNPRINRIIDEFLDKQTALPLRLTSHDMNLLAVPYCEAVRWGAERLVKELCEAVANRRVLGARECKWIKTQVDSFISKLTSHEGASYLLALALPVTISNQQKAEQMLAETLAELAGSGLLTRKSDEALKLGLAQHGRSNVRRANAEIIAPAALKVTDPLKFPMLTVAEAQKVLGKSRSTIYRWLDEGRLSRASLGRSAGKRGSCMILTNSLKKLLEESTE
jgi:excisionase family DNA binding protein